jgi:hypothetical protein
MKNIRIKRMTVLKLILSIRKNEDINNNKRVNF